MLVLKDAELRKFLYELGFKQTNACGYDPNDETEYFYKTYGKEYEASGGTSGGIITINNEYYNSYYGNIPLNVRLPDRHFNCALDKDLDNQIKEFNEAIQITKEIQEDVLKILNYCKTRCDKEAAMKKKLIDALKEKGFEHQYCLPKGDVYGTWRGMWTKRGTFVDIVVESDYVAAYQHDHFDHIVSFPFWIVEKGKKPEIKDKLLSDLTECIMPWEEEE